MKDSSQSSEQRMPLLLHRSIQHFLEMVTLAIDRYAL